MTIRLLDSALIAGLPRVAGDIVGADAGTEAALVASGRAAYVTPRIDYRRALVQARNGVALGAAGDDLQLLPNVFGNGVFRAPLKLATFGDSRENFTGNSLVNPVSSGATNVFFFGGKTPLWVAFFLGDAEMIYNAGLSGDPVSNWQSASRSDAGGAKDVATVLAQKPDVVLIQYGVNDVISWNGTNYDSSKAAIIANLKACCAEFAKAGILVAYEAIHPCTAAAGAYITGATSAGGYGTNAAEKARMVAEINWAMEEFMGQLGGAGVFSDTFAWLKNAGDNYANTAWMSDGTHINGAAACRAGKQQADDIRRVLAPRRGAYFVDGSGPNILNTQMLAPTAGQAANVFTGAEAGTATFDQWKIGADEYGPYQEVRITPLTLASGQCRQRIEFHGPVGGGSPTYPVALNDVFQAQLRLLLDDGNGGAPNAWQFKIRHRVFYVSSAATTPAGLSSSYADTADMSVLEPPEFPVPIVGRHTLPKLTLASASSNIAVPGISVGYSLQAIVSSRNVGVPMRLRVQNPMLRKVA